MPDRPPVHRPLGWRPRQPWERARPAPALPGNWRRLRDAVLQAEPLCRPCNEAGRVTAAAEVDHIVPRTQGGGDDRNNLQPICRACHRRKSAGEGAAASARCTGDTE